MQLLTFRDSVEADGATKQDALTILVLYVQRTAFGGPKDIESLELSRQAVTTFLSFPFRICQH